MTSRRRAKWQGATLLQLIGAMQKAVGGLEVDWNHKIAVVLTHADVSGWWCRVATAHAHHIVLQYRTQPGQFTPTMLERLGESPYIKRNGRGGGDEIWIGLRDMKEIHAGAFAKFLKAYHVGVCKAFGAKERRRS